MIPPDAISPEAASIKRIRSEVAGKADVLVVPDLDSGNMLAKSIEQIGQADMAGVVVGAHVPMILTSRSDEPKARLASAAVARLLADQNVDCVIDEPVPLGICNG